MRASRVLVLFLATPLLSGCAHLSFTPVGDSNYRPLGSGTGVFIFPDEDDVDELFEVVGTIEYANPGKYQQISLRDVFPLLRERAREAGANGVIIDDRQTIVSGIASRGIAVRARAIRLLGRRAPE
jgi:hypothetical protein